MALKACGIGHGDEVITVSFTAVATVAAVELCGATPVLVDINSDTYTLDPDQIASVISPRTKAILPVHLYGHPADMDQIVSLADEHNLFVVEDCAQSHGALYQGKKTGSLGDIAAFSFYPTKNLGAIGDGGMVVTDDAALEKRVRLLRQYGWEHRNDSCIPGMNSRLDELQAAILRVKLNHLDAENIRRRNAAHEYRKNLQSTGLTLPNEGKNTIDVYHQYVIRTLKRDLLKLYLAEHGVDTLIHYPVPVHLQLAYRDSVQLENRQLPMTESICKEILSLPMHPYIEKQDIRLIADRIKDFFEMV